jgi:hypothetical protein
VNIYWEWEKKSQIITNLKKIVTTTVTKSREII